MGALWGSVDLGSVSSSDTDLLSDLGQVPAPPCASVSLTPFVYSDCEILVARPVYDPVVSCCQLAEATGVHKGYRHPLDLVHQRVPCKVSNESPCHTGPHNHGEMCVRITWGVMYRH